MKILDYVLRRDPATGIWLFACWSALLGIALVLPSDVFKLVPAWQSLAKIGFSENFWGITMILDGIILFYSPFSTGHAAKSFLAFLSGLLWMFVGYELIDGSWRAGYLSGSGPFCVLGAIGCFLAMSQWVNDA